MKIPGKCLTTVVLVAGAAMATSAARAETMMHPSMYDTRSVTVSYKDLNLSKEAGVQTLYHRLQQASEKVCAPRHDGSRFSNHRAWSTCFGMALDHAVISVNHPRLSEVHYAQNHRPTGSIAQSAWSR